MSRVHRLGTTLEKTAGDQVEHVVRPVADGYLVLPDTEPSRQCLLQVPGVGIRIEPDIVDRVFDRGPRQWRTAQWIFVRCELVRVAYAELTFEFLDRFTRLVGL